MALGAANEMRLAASAAEREHLMPEPMRPGTARCQVGVATANITPPVGIHSRCWGAAESDVATGIHKPLFVHAMALTSNEGNDEDGVVSKRTTLVFVAVDLGWLQRTETAALHAAIVQATGLPEDHVLVQMSHTHAGVSMSRPLVDPDCPGRDIALEWWENLLTTAPTKAVEAIGAVQPCWITSGYGSCNLAQKRDFWDLAADGFVTAMDPTTYGKADTTVAALRVVPISGEDAGTTLATVCNYGCHPTSLGHPSSLISPDWPGSARDVVNETCGGTCIFLLGACGDTMPAQGHQGDPRVTERDGKKVGLATAATIIGMPTAGTQLTYSGPIVSGAVIGSWTPSPLPDILVSSLSALRTCTLTVRVPIRQLETSAAAKTRLEQAEERLVKVRSGDLVDDVSVRDATALVEQARRNLAKIVDFESSEPGRVKIWIWQLGDIFLVATSGEPYSAFQIELRHRVPSGVTVIVAAMTNGSMTPGYILPAEHVGCGCYQDRIGLLGSGALELMVAAAASQIADWCYNSNSRQPQKLL